jgi:OOP family OmpA-OmpF porin
MDDDILSGMLTAIQDFVRDAFKDKSKFALKRLDFGESEIFMARGTGFYIAVVFSGTEPPELEEKLDKTITDIEAEFGEILKEWAGNRNEVRGIKDHLDGLLK